MQSGSIADGNDKDIISAPDQQPSILKSMLELESMFDFSLYGLSVDAESAALHPIRTFKNLLAAGSKYFRALFTNKNFNDSETNDHTSKLFSHECLKAMVEFLHKGAVHATSTQFAIDLLNSARYYQVHALVSACETYLVSSLKVDNVIDMWKSACHHDWSSTFVNEIEKFIAKNLSKMMIERSFLDLSSKQICKLLELKPVVTSASSDICLQAALAWLESDPEKRRINSTVVMKSVPLSPGMISRKVLINACRSKVMSPSVKHEMLELLTSYLDLDVSEFISVPDYVAPSSGVSASSSIEKLYLVGSDREACSKQFIQYDVHRKEWTQLASLPWSRYNATAGIFDGDRLLVFGGMKDEVLTADVDEFNFSSFRWSKISTLPTKGYWSGCGSRQNAYLSNYRGDLITYSASSKEVVANKDMPCKRGWHSASFSANLNSVFVADGFSGDKPNLKFYPRIEKYDIASDTWQSVGFTKIKCCVRASALCGDELYLVGGCDRMKDVGVDKVEVCNVRTGKVWATPDLPAPRFACQAALLYNNVICVFGDIRGVAAYDVREGNWTTGNVVPDMPVRSAYFGLAWK